MVNTLHQTAHLPRLLCSLGMTPWDCPTSESVTSSYAILLDGRVVGYVEEQLADDLVKRLRIMKVNGLEQVSKSNDTLHAPDLHQEKKWHPGY